MSASSSLSLVGLRIAVEKMGQLTGLTSALVAFRKSLEEPEKRLEKRTREILVRGGGDALLLGLRSWMPSVGMGGSD